ncbi:short-chain dehydrogenase/reductase [Shewanella colwelliana]|uniref:Short-chain dehydrogenase n=1 Tax=Shewanella colwelliana TaxID=23 RepID=A0A1E5IXV1_SHECO|nr:SDR family NAD(P)-dependent oxidoreductase [Shewanella colwelliana]MDX1281198.1 SDR family NAD(P)-dependent oxidoreductase [Shewanella colwelliana]OEG75412.1 short-chain dehydrogenase [Shewanella colwelliana]GIU22758.1 short-chain dehydrogenase/reductase [Shewanella colwelliana]GIU35938.1 short-chain dehydrogenase/reductase [Shewanella colwelliana]
MRFDDQVAVITGAGAGLGRAYAIALAERGARVALIDSGCADSRYPKELRSGLDNTLRTLKELGATAVSYRIDVRDHDAVVTMIECLQSLWGRIDILINNASIHQPCAFDALTIEQWQQQLDVDVNGSFYLAKAVWPLMKLQGYGRIIMSGAASGLYGDMHETCFSTSKMALMGLVNSLSIEGREYNIGVNSITPHALTDMTASHLAPSVKPLFSKSSVNATMLYLSSKWAPTGQHFLVAAGSVSHGMFTEFQPLRIGEDDCKPEVIHENWHTHYQQLPVVLHQSGEEQITAWAKRSAAERHVVIE